MRARRKRIAAGRAGAPACRLTRWRRWGVLDSDGWDRHGRRCGGPGAVTRALARLGLLHGDEAPGFTRLAGGVSSDIWRVDLVSGPVCVKRALPKLRVEQDWFAPVERNAYEAAWMRFAAAVVPEAVPALLGQDAAAGVLVMAYLDPASHRLWKADLREGHADPDVARAVGESPGAHPCRERQRSRRRRRRSPPTGSSTTSGSSRIWSRARAPIPIGPMRCRRWSRPPRATGAPWCTATSAPRTS